jgi:hypothetical protein
MLFRNSQRICQQILRNIRKKGIYLKGWWKRRPSMLEERRRENDPPKKPSFAMVSSETRLWSRQSSPSHSSLHDKTFSAQWVFLLGRFNFVREREREREGGDPGKKYVEEMWWKRRVFVNKMFFLHRMCIPNTNESALIYIVLPAWLVIHRRFCIFLSFLF